MRKVLDETNLESVAGGMYDIDNTNTVYFSTSPYDGYSLKKSRYGAQEIMDNLQGKYATEEEYDQACINELRVQGYID